MVHKKGIWSNGKVDGPLPKKLHTSNHPEGLRPSGWEIPNRVAQNFGFQTEWGQFHSFILKASIPEWNEASPMLHWKRTYYNDDLFAKHFQSSSMHFAGKQRRGVVDEHLECMPLSEHVDTALSAPFFLSLETPLPASTARAAVFLRGSPANSVLSFWGAQIRKLGELIRATSKLQHSWGELIPPATRPAAGKLQLVALDHLAHACGLGGSAWLTQFMFGFPPDGKAIAKGMPFQS